MKQPLSVERGGKKATLALKLIGKGNIEQNRDALKCDIKQRPVD